MKRVGTISYNLYCNFTNYGSALQTWALHQVIKKLGYQPVLIDYCPEILADKNPLDPFKNMWDRSEDACRRVEAMLPAITVNYEKYNKFFAERLEKTSRKYTADNFSEVVEEGVYSFICGADTIFCPDEFGIDDGYYAEYPVMRGNTISYGASFGDPHFTEEDYRILDERLQNFKAMGIREEQMIPYIANRTTIPVQRTLDPTLLLDAEEYSEITADRENREKYLLFYSRRFTPSMERYAERYAKAHHLKIVDISLRDRNEIGDHEMAYEAGVEEFVSLVKHAEFIITNSYHGMLFSIIFRRPYVIFSREQCDNKIKEVSELLGVSDRVLVTGEENLCDINYDNVYKKILEERKKSIDFLKMSLGLI